MIGNKVELDKTGTSSTHEPLIERPIPELVETRRVMRIVFNNIRNLPKKELKKLDPEVRESIRKLTGHR